MKVFSQLNRKNPKGFPLPQFEGKTFCPRCKSEGGEIAEFCPRCGFSLPLSEAMFPFEPPSLSLILDPSGILPPGTEKNLLRPYKALRKRIPQADICFCFVQLEQGCSVEEFSFWLFNTAPDADQSRAWNLLVTVDLTSGQLSLTCGYALESFLARESWEASLQQLAACLGDGQWHEGLAGFLRDSRNLLSSACYAACRYARSHNDTPLEVTKAPEDLRDRRSPARTSTTHPEPTKHHQPRKEPVTTGS